MHNKKDMGFILKKNFSSFLTSHKKRNISKNIFSSSFYDLRLPLSSKIKLVRSESKVLYKHYYGDLGLVEKDFIFRKLNIEKDCIKNLVCSPIA